MNEKAQMIGMLHSHFMNPHGLDNKDHYSTANDMALLTAYALRNPIFQEIVQTKLKKVPNPNESWAYQWENKNKMLSVYPGANGVKTGYTKLALRCLISSATRDGQQLAVVTLNDSDDWADHSRLLDYGFKNFPLSHLIDKGETVQKGLVTMQSLYYPLSMRQKGQLTRNVLLFASTSISSRLGTLGHLQVFLSNRLIASVPLAAPDSPLLDKSNVSAFSFRPSIQQMNGDFSEKWRSFFHALFRI
jgi:D-alanyl-D-alanine carboxypeptidase